MLEVKALKIQRGNHRLSYDLQLPEGDILAIQGRSGCGKSTLLSAIAGFLSADYGDIIWRGETLNQLSPEQRPVSMLFQDHNLFEHLDIWQNISLGFAGPAPLEAIQLAAKILEIEDQLDKMPGELSGGQRQRIILIRTLLRPEPLILLDEPFAELDPHTRQQATEWTRATAKSSGKTMLLVTHQHDDVEQVADQCLQL